MRPGVKGTVTFVTGVFRRLLDAGAAGQTIRSASETFLPPDCRAVERALDALERLEHLRQLGGLVDFPILLRRQRMRAPFAPPRLSEPRNVDADAQAVETSCETDRPEPGSCLQRGDVLAHRSICD
jgi:hypothetical protein